MKLKEELTALKEEVESLKGKFCQLTDDELEKVIGGAGVSLQPYLLNYSLEIIVDN